MPEWIARANILHFRKLLKTEKDPKKRALIERELAEEEQKLAALIERELAEEEQKLAALIEQGKQEGT